MTDKERIDKGMAMTLNMINEIFNDCIEAFRNEDYLKSVIYSKFILDKIRKIHLVSSFLVQENENNSTSLYDRGEAVVEALKERLKDNKESLNTFMGNLLDDEDVDKMSNNIFG